MTNKHLNHFQFFDTAPKLENNLTRGIAICMKNEPTFLLMFVKQLLDEDSYEHFTKAIADNSLEIDIQIDCTTQNYENEIKKIHAISLTTIKLDTSNFYQYSSKKSGKKFTDIYMQFGDEALIIETKRTDEDCLYQLHGQAIALLNYEEKDFEKSCKIYSTTWSEVLNIMEAALSLKTWSKKDSYLLKDFVIQIRLNYPHWLDSIPISQLRKPFDVATIEQMNKRIDITKKNEFNGNELTIYQDRLAINVSHCHWASEVIPYCRINNTNKQPEVILVIWPANTKDQGKFIDYSKLNWTNKTTMEVQGKKLPLSVYKQIKFSHFMGRHVTNIYFSDVDLKEGCRIYSAENFRNWCGKVDRINWREFEVFFDNYFKEDFNWREECKWDESLVNSNRKFFFLSFGFEVVTYIDFDLLRSIDKNEKPNELGKLLRDVSTAFTNKLMD